MAEAVPPEIGRTGVEPLERTIDYLVVGAGPAGLQLGYFLERAGRDYLVLEAGSRAGTFFETFPRHRQMISINKPHTGFDDPELNLRWDWNSLLSDDERLRFTRYTGLYFPQADDYVRYLNDFAAAHAIRVRYDARVTSIDRADGGPFTVTTAGGDVLHAGRVIVATGFTRPYVPEIEGIETAEEYGTMPVDPKDYADQRVLLIGKGNSAFETADALTEHAAVIHIAGPSSLKFAWRTHFIGHLRAVNNNFLDTYQLKTQNSVLDCTIDRIERLDDGRYRVTVGYLRRDETVRFEYDRVVAATGFRMDPSIFAPRCRPELTIRGRFPLLTHEWESVNVPDLYFAGTLTQSRDFKKYTSAFVHGFRYGIRCLQRILDRKYEGIPLPARELPAAPEPIMDAVLARINRTSGLWLQFHFLADVVAVDDGTARYHEELPVDFVLEGDLQQSARELFLVTLEYGPGHDLIDPFDIAVGREWEMTHQRDDRYLHPVVRHYRDGELRNTLRLKENLDNDWTDPDLYRRPLAEFVEHCLAGGTEEPAAEPEPAPIAFNVRDFETLAKERLDPVHYDYFAGGAQDERTVAANEDAYARISLIPRVLRGTASPATTTTLLGCETTAPILLAPTAFHRLAHPDGEPASARAAASTGTIQIAAMLSTVAIEDIAAAAPDAMLWFQLYVQPDLDFTASVVRRAENAGVRAFVVTADSPVLGRAERGDRNDFHDLPPDLKCENLRIGGRTGHVRSVDLSPQISWRHIEWLREATDRPVAVKGILHPEDARIAVEHGVDAILVSNHGGRQLDSAPATVDRLPAIVEAVRGRVPVIVDGGIRRGTDVAKALALGADAVAVGRPALWGLAADGERGVARVLEILRTELVHTLTLCGVASPHDLDRGYVDVRSH